MRNPLTEQQILDFRQRLCEAAEELFAVHGVSGVTMRQIAQRLGVSQTTPYKYFSNKEEILAAVRASAFRRFSERLERARGGVDARADARAVGQAYLDFAEQESNAYHLMFDTYQPHASAYPEFVLALHQARACMTSYVQALIDEGLLSGDAESLGELFWAAAHGLVVLQGKGFIGSRKGVRELHEQLMRYVWKGVLAESEASLASN
ncbi:TetR/AcrR family transcriptional regulator [Pseudomonas aeruginosa]|uniref:TetR/AcrR family transcriptional regulator n=1 Tax=Pseudomonas aeruginosa TaxID=287 RepID=UPI000EAFE9BD|nr:TetR/AcrR family transcriptional regulator [Pseudomonas aeruginosa]EIU1413946.1 TetR/AcrR family transcriptional regulator [Pseudomonas aeruginosa]MCG9956502.1 TetR/AcrR family transcriptional regulator [Pseudomonas aeruginosa]RPW10791.1 TetR family transcriptional regulator [Pseudomonas aeruginosa]RTB51801.1 TetR/AcrR family transcriptional regulator [Pseudomonas aeruginosa]RTC34179.1 TetR/AcrR family transcriptional regulator [Pseudomonas aeruginosa]